MPNKFYSLTMLLGLTVGSTLAADFTGSLYIEDATIVPGDQTTLSVQLENNIAIRGFQFKMTLANGISYDSWTFSDERFPDGASTSDVIKSQNFSNQVLSVAGTLNSGENAQFKGNSGEIATITISADENMPEGIYTVDVTAIDVNDPSGNDFDVQNTSFTLTVSKNGKTYDEGFAVQVLPFAYNADTEIALTLDNAMALTSVAFDVVLPEAFINKELYYFDAALSKAKYTINYEEKSNGLVHVTVERRSSNVIASGSGTDVALLGLVASNAVSKGVYPISIKNIKLTAENGKKYEAAPYTTEIFAGDNPQVATVNGFASFHGNYGGANEYQLMKASLTEGIAVDLTETSALYSDPAELNMGVFFITTDSYSYGRTMNTEWGTFCLPFAIESTSNIQLYKLTNVSSSALTFDKVSAVAAHTPVLFIVSGNSASVKVANDGSISQTFVTDHASDISQKQEVSNWVFKGSYTDKTIDVSSLQVYALNNDIFYKVNSKLNIKAYHGWLQNNGTALGALLRIDDDTESIEVIEQEDGQVQLLFDLQGRRVKSAQPKQIIIVNDEKQYNK